LSTTFSRERVILTLRSNGHMEAIYYGDNTIWGSGAGSGPWIMADLENGLFSGVNVKQNTGDPTITSRFVTAAIKGGPNKWAIRGGNSASGALSTYYNGVRPNANGYNPMSKEGAIILGIGGDNSISGQGTFYEGVMTSGYPSDATENSVQNNIVAAKYATTSLVSGPAFSVGSSVSLRVTLRIPERPSTPRSFLLQVALRSSNKLAGPFAPAWPTVVATLSNLATPLVALSAITILNSNLLPMTTPKLSKKTLHSVHRLVSVAREVRSVLGDIRQGTFVIMTAWDISRVMVVCIRLMRRGRSTMM
jgi:hypothetical protein